MKTLITAALLIFTSSAFSANKEVVHTTGRVSLNDLTCVTAIESSFKDQKGTLVSRHRTTTQIGGGRNNYVSIFFDKENEPAKLRIEMANNVGCPLQKLSKIKSESIQFFGYRQSKIEIVKQTSPSYRDNDGGCIAMYSETVNIDLGYGIVLISDNSIYVKKNDCK